MPPELRIAYFAHSVRSDWNNGNAHFLRGLLRNMAALGHEVRIFEPEDGWSITNLLTEPEGRRSLSEFAASYPDLHVHPYRDGSFACLASELRGTDVVILHEWNPPELAQHLLELRKSLRYRLLFHDTHHRASSSPDQIARFGLQSFDGVLAFGEALRAIYRERFGIERCWTLHEAADTTVFRPCPDKKERSGVVWIGNWGDGERTDELSTYLLNPAMELSQSSFTVYGVRYPADALEALAKSHIRYGGYAPNLDGPRLYASAAATVHVPRQAYTTAMVGIPTIRVFEALACGIPLVSAPWNDTERLFRAGDFLMARDTAEMVDALRLLISDSKAAEAQASRGLETVLARHTCRHRAEQLTSICEEILQ